MKSILSNIEIYLSIPDLGTVKGSFKSEGFLEFFNYFVNLE